jgi:tRNA(fMet)-specific endonuclease VapC
MPYLLDTNICVFYLRGKLNLDKIIRDKGIDNFYISEITVIELRFGAENSDNPSKSHIAVDAFLNGTAHYPNLWLHQALRKRKSTAKKDW